MTHPMPEHVAQSVDAASQEADQVFLDWLEALTPATYKVTAKAALSGIRVRRIRAWNREISKMNDRHQKKEG